jgi:hypothetical protein
MRARYVPLVNDRPRVTVSEIAAEPRGDGSCQWSFLVRGLTEPLPAARFQTQREAERARRRFTRGIEMLARQGDLRPL